MKNYEKPIAKTNEYSLIDRIASLDNWLSSGGSALGVDEDIESYKTSYNMAS